MNTTEFSRMLDLASTGDAMAQARLDHLALTGELDAHVAALTAGDELDDDWSEEDFDALIAEIDYAEGGDPPLGVMLAQLAGMQGRPAPPQPADLTAARGRVLDMASVSSAPTAAPPSGQVFSAAWRAAMEREEQFADPNGWAERSADAIRAASDAAWERFDRERLG